MAKLVELTTEIKHKDEVATFKQPLDINKLLPGLTSFSIDIIKQLIHLFFSFPFTKQKLELTTLIWDHCKFCTLQHNDNRFILRFC